MKRFEEEEREHIPELENTLCRVSSPLNHLRKVRTEKTVCEVFLFNQNSTLTQQIFFVFFFSCYGFLFSE